MAHRRIMTRSAGRVKRTTASVRGREGMADNGARPAKPATKIRSRKTSAGKRATRAGSAKRSPRTGTRLLPDEVIAVIQRIARRGTFADPNDPAS
jgi:hypothetical protein